LRPSPRRPSWRLLIRRLLPRGRSRARLCLLSGRHRRSSPCRPHRLPSPRSRPLLRWSPRLRQLRHSPRGPRSRLCLRMASPWSSLRLRRLFRRERQRLRPRPRRLRHRPRSMFPLLRHRSLWRQHLQFRRLRFWRRSLLLLLRRMSKRPRQRLWHLRRKKNLRLLLRPSKRRSRSRHNLLRWPLWNNPS
jgi:hypothetical protein